MRIQVRSCVVVIVLLMSARGLAAQVYHYYGCGSTFGTCASVTLTATPAPPSRNYPAGSWLITGSMLNEAHRAPNPDYWNGMAWCLGVNTYDSWGELYYGYEEYDCGGCNGGPEYNPETGQWEGGLSVIWSRWSGALDPVCAANPSCAESVLKDFTDYGPPAHPYQYPGQAEFNYIPGRVTIGGIVMSWGAGGWQPGDGLELTQGFVGANGQAGWGGGFESYTLTVRNESPVVTPEPVTMSLLATGLAGVGLARRRRRVS